MALGEAEVTLLLAIEASRTPVGSRKAADALSTAGIAVSESTVSRLLRRLDEQDLTRPLDAKGRVLTEAGRREVRGLAARSRQAEILRETADVQNVKELLDLLYARRGVEREAARAAAHNAVADDIERLQELVRGHQTRLQRGEAVRHGALTFHQVIGEMAANQFLGAMMEVLFAPAMDRTEAILDVIIGSHHSEARSVKEHIAVVEAIVAHEPDRADAAMAAHLGRLIDETEQFAASENGDLVNRLITWASQDQD